MRLAIFCHSLISDWNHGNAHFLRGVVHELLLGGHEVSVWEPADGWSRSNLESDLGNSAIVAFDRAFPALRSTVYVPDELDFDAILADHDLCLVHEWSEPFVVDRLADARRGRPNGARVLWHDTHHRAVSAPDALARLAPQRFDGALVFGESLARIYRDRGLAEQAWVWHEAADVRVFRPRPGARDGDLVWVGNWGGDERAEELGELLIEPVQRLGLDALVHGVRYPEDALQRLDDAGIRYGGHLANHRVPDVFARYAATVHVPRRPYVEQLHGIPTIRVFEALACGIPLICSRFRDTEGLFRPGRDYLEAERGDDVVDGLRDILGDPHHAADVARSGLETIRARHTCAHRADELLAIAAQVGVAGATEPAGGPQR